MCLYLLGDVSGTRISWNSEWSFCKHAVTMPYHIFWRGVLLYVQDAETLFYFLVSSAVKDFLYMDHSRSLVVAAGVLNIIQWITISTFPIAQAGLDETTHMSNNPA